MLYIPRLTSYDARLMLRPDAKALDLRRIGRDGEEMVGELPTRSMDRLRDLLLNLPPAVQVNLFWQPRGGVVQVDGEIHAAAEAECQRCLGSMPLHLVARVHAGVGATEAFVSRQDPERDPVLAPDERLGLEGWVEDELILSVPIAPMCDLWKGGVCPLSQIDPGLQTL